MRSAPAESGDADLRGWLARTELLRGVPADVLDDCAARATQCHYAAGETVVRAGERGASLYLVRHGRVCMPLPGAPAGSTALEFGAGQVLGAI